MRKRTVLPVLLVAGVIGRMSAQSSQNSQAPPAPRQALRASASCERLASLSLPDATITVARTVDAGAFTPPPPAGGGVPSGGAAQAFAALPAFCRVAATLRPSDDSDIRIEVWMPAAEWNGK